MPHCTRMRPESKEAAVTPASTLLVRIPTLDGLRAVAIVIVIASHVFQDNRTLAALGHMGVLIFFALSGYLITSRLLIEYRSNGSISLRDFYLRRAFRILPPALAYLGVLALLNTLGLIVCSGPVIRSALFFYTNYIDIVPAGWRAGHFWSLSVEEHFYLFWPFLLIALGVLTGWRTAAALAIAISLWRIGDNHFHIFARAFNAPYLQGFEYRTDLIADTLLWGCCLAFVRLRLTAAVSTTIALASFALLVLLMMGIPVPGMPRNIDYSIPIMHALPAILLGAVVSCPAAPIGRLLDVAPMRFVGNLSYSLYIWQQLFLWGPDGPRMPAPIGICAAVACAYLSYRFVEKPCIALGRRVVRRPEGIWIAWCRLRRMVC
jgi:peptidoglycan/LPS O-acetylase OafA/YrhL